MRSRYVIITAIALTIGGVAAPALADTKAGVEAWERGDYRTAVDQWRVAADAGDADAQFNLGQAYKLGRGVPVDSQRAEDYYRKAAAQGHVQAEDNYGLALFQNGKPREAAPYLEKSVARGEPRAQYILGTMLFNGVDIGKDWVRAYALTSRAADAGLPQAAQSMQQMDTYLGIGEREQGLALARTMDEGGGELPAQVAGTGSGGGMRGVDLPPSYAEIHQPTYVPRQPAPPPSDADALPARHYPPAQQPVRRTPPVPVQAAATGGRWRLQLGAFGEPGNARKLWTALAGRFPGRSVDYVKAGALTKVLVGPFASKATAQAACGTVNPCVPVGP